MRVIVSCRAEAIRFHREMTRVIDGIRVPISSFKLRFQETKNLCMPCWKRFSLDTPNTWAENCQTCAGASPFSSRLRSGPSLSMCLQRFFRERSVSGGPHLIFSAGFGRVKKHFVHRLDS